MWFALVQTFLFTKFSAAVEITACAKRQQEVVMASAVEPSRAAALVSNVPARARRGVIASPNGRRKRQRVKEGRGSLWTINRKGAIFCLTQFLKKYGARHKLHNQ